MPELQLEKRQDTGKKIAKKLRRTGKVPGVYYTHGKKAMPVTIDERALKAIIASEVNIIDLKIDNKTYKSIVREIQFDPVVGVPLHVDFMGVKLDEKIHMTVPIRLVGSPLGVKEGGILQQLVREIEVAALPMDLPEHVDIDVSELKIGDSVHIGSLTIDKVEILTDVERSIATVSAPTIVKEPTVEEAVIGVEGEEPEVEGERGEVSERE